MFQTSKDYYCQYCDKIYKSSSKRKAHIIKNHPGKSLPPSNRNKGSPTGVATNTFSATVGSITMNPHFCSWCHKQYASKAKLMQHQRKKHTDKINFFSSSKSTKSDVSFSCTSNSESSLSSKLESIADSDKSALDASQNTSNPNMQQVKIESSSEQKIGAISHDAYKGQKLDPFLSGSSVNNGTFLNNFCLSNQYSKNDSYLNGSGAIQQQQDGQFTIDSSDPSLDDLLNITTCIVSDEQNQNLLISNSSSSTPSMSNNIITILACTVPSTCTTFSSELNEFPNGISDIITQITSEFPNAKLLNSTQVSPLSNETSDGNLIISEEIEGNNWNQVCGEMAIV